MSTLELIDTHAHLDSSDFAEDLDAVLTRASDVGVRQIVTIGASRGFESNHAALRLAETHPFIFATVGIHPHDAAIFTDALLAEIEAMAEGHPKVVGVGETGLDYYYDYGTPAQQQAAFRAFVQLGRRTGKPLVIHTRDAEADTIAILEEEGAASVGGVLHCFSGSRWLAERGLALGFYVSFSGIVTFKKADVIKEVAAMVPLDRVLIETDAPWLAPAPRRGKRNEPALVEHTLRAVAALRGMDPVELAAATAANARRLFGLPVVEQSA